MLGYFFVCCLFWLSCMDCGALCGAFANGSRLPQNVTKLVCKFVGCALSASVHLVTASGETFECTVSCDDHDAALLSLSTGAARMLGCLLENVRLTWGFVNMEMDQLPALSRSHADDRWLLASAFPGRLLRLGFAAWKQTDVAQYCQTCQTWLNGHTQMEDHVCNRKHRNNVRSEGDRDCRTS